MAGRRYELLLTRKTTAGLGRAVGLAVTIGFSVSVLLILSVHNVVALLKLIAGVWLLVVLCGLGFLALYALDWAALFVDSGRLGRLTRFRQRGVPIDEVTSIRLVTTRFFSQRDRTYSNDLPYVLVIGKDARCRLSFNAENWKRDDLERWAHAAGLVLSGRWSEVVEARELSRQYPGSLGGLQIGSWMVPLILFGIACIGFVIVLQAHLL